MKNYDFKNTLSDGDRSEENTLLQIKLQKDLSWRVIALK